MSDNNDYTVKAVFSFKDQSSKEKFIDFCNGDNGLSVTRSWEGCKSIECYEEIDEPLSVVIWQKWASKTHQESYVKHRHEDGSFDFLGELISKPPQITPIRPLVFKTDKQQIEEIIEDMCHKDHNKAMHHMVNDCVFIRPTGNPLTKSGWDEMMNNPNVSVEDSSLLSINKLQIMGNAAYVCYTAHNKFNYMGNANDDIAVFTSVLQKTNGVWSVVHGQRSTGRTPDSDLPKF